MNYLDIQSLFIGTVYVDDIINVHDFISSIYYFGKKLLTCAYEKQDNDYGEWKGKRGDILDDGMLCLLRAWNYKNSLCALPDIIRGEFGLEF
jgi:hypothetical protein